MLRREKICSLYSLQEEQFRGENQRLLPWAIAIKYQAPPPTVGIWQSVTVPIDLQLLTKLKSAHRHFAEQAGIILIPYV